MHTALTVVLILAYMALTVVIADIAKGTHRRYQRSVRTMTSTSPTYTVRQALTAAAVEVCWTRPRAFNASRVAAVLADTDAQQAALEGSIRRHPASHRARMACMSEHPAAWAKNHRSESVSA